LLIVANGRIFATSTILNMTDFKEFKFGGRSNPLGNLGPLFGLIIFLVIGYFLITGLFGLLAKLSPFLLIGAAILDYTVILDYGKFIIKLLKENPLMGLIAILLSIIGYPVLFGFLLFKAYARKKVKSFVERVEKEKNKYDDYEEVKIDSKKNEDDFMILKEVKKTEPIEKEKPKNDYDDLFK
jgi:hypothetical protein